MSRFVIEVIHDPDECVKALREFETYPEDLLDEVYWSCVSGDHTGRIMVEAESLQQAWSMVPDSLRDRVAIREAEQIIPELAETGVVDPETKNFIDSGPDAS
ncbi:MAG: hypothetical protein ACPL7O_10145 [Armatimonadota bacterium]